MRDRRVDVGESRIVRDERRTKSAPRVPISGPISFSTTARNSDGRAAARPMLSSPPKLVPIAITRCRCSAAHDVEHVAQAGLGRVAPDVARRPDGRARHSPAPRRGGRPSACDKCREVAGGAHDAGQAQQRRARIAVPPFADAQAADRPRRRSDGLSRPLRQQGRRALAAARAIDHHVLQHALHVVARLVDTGSARSSRACRSGPRADRRSPAATDRRDAVPAL